MIRNTQRITAGFILAVFIASGAIRARGQEPLLRITSPANGDVVIEGKPLVITVSADPSVRFVAVIGWNPLPFPQPIGANQFQMMIPKTVPSGRYNLTAIGATSTDVSSEPVSIDVEREDPATGLQVTPPALSFASPGEMPISIIAQFADGSKLDVTHSSKTTFLSKNPDVVTIDDRAMANGVGPGRGIILAGYSSIYGAVVVFGPHLTPKGPSPELDSVSPETGIPGITIVTILGRHFGETQGNGYVQIGTMNGVIKSWSDEKIVAIVPENTHKGVVEVDHGGLYSNHIDFVPTAVCIDAFSGKFIPGEQIRIIGSGFGSEQGSGFVTFAAARANIINWSGTEITITVPAFVTKGDTYKLSVKQNGSSADASVFAEPGAW